MDFKLVRDATFGYLKVDPMPTKKELAKIYEQEFYTELKPQYFKTYEEDRDWWNLVYKERYNFFEHHLPRHLPKTLLDIGSGPGLFLLHGQNRGWSVKGLEPSHSAALYSKALGVDVVNEFLNEDCSVREAFSVVHMSEVLEHIPDPADFLTLAKRRLVPGGIACICVPNDFNPFQKILTEVSSTPQWWVNPPQHLNYFDQASLLGLISSVGFHPIYDTTTFPIDLFLLMGENYIEDADLGRKCHAKRKRLELLMDKAGMTDLRLNWYKAMSELGIGRELIVYAQKKP